MKMSRWIVRAAAFLAIPLGSTALSAQGITTSAINARVTDPNGVVRSGARVVAVHLPSGTIYEARTRPDGRATLPGMRVGGPYRVTASAIGAQPDVKDDVFLTLGVATDIEFALKSVPVMLGEVTITGASETVFSSHRTGAATSVNRQAIQTLPTIQGRIEDFVRVTPQYSGGGGFAGIDNRMNNITIDGSYFNNSFGLAGQPGDRTNVAPISMEAIEQVQVNIAPYDVRQGNFIGAGVNTVTRSGTNEYTGSLYYSFRDNQRTFHGTKARAADVNPGNFDFSKLGVSFGGPIIKDRLFFFLSYENDELLSPGTTFRANEGGETVGGNITRVLKTDLDALSTYLSTNFGYETGPYQAYDHATPATRYLARLDFNLNANNKISARYNQLDSFTDILLSNSSSLGNGTRRSNTTGLNFQNSNYKMGEYIDSWALEWNSILGARMSNNLIIGYSHHDESRGSRGSFFPMVDILNAGTVYTTFGFEPFTPNNELRYGSTQIQNAFSVYSGGHEFTFGFSGEKYRSENVFFPGSQSAYVYNSLQDFYDDADDYLANPTRTTSPVTLNRFQVRWANVPGMTEPLQPLDVTYAGIFAQDQWRINPKTRLTLGLRIDRPSFGNNGFQNAEVDAMNFRDETGATVKYSTSKLPDATLLFSPRLGINYDVYGNRDFQIRGGTGIFTGRPAYVWISNQIGENGILTGFENLTNVTSRPFHPDPNHYKPTTVNGTPAASYGLAFTQPDFKFPQLWRTDVAVDKKLPWGLVGTGELLYNRDVNGVYYINANLPIPDGNYTGVDSRPRWFQDKCPTTAGTQANLLNCKIANAIVLKNSNEAYSWNAAASIERPFRLGTFIKAAYSYGLARGFVDPGSIALGSWTGNQITRDPNNPGIQYAATSPGHRFFAAASYRKNLIRAGATTASLFWETRTIGNASYTFANDVNGDGGSANDLIYIPKDKSEMNFETFTTGGRTFTAAEQADAWEAYIQQDKYLRSHRGEYAERGAVFLPLFSRADVGFAQDLSGRFLRQGHTMQVRLDFLNFGNLLNHNWGVSQRLVNAQPLTNTSVDANGALRYRLRVVNNQLMTKSLERSAGLTDVYRIQMTVRYNFN